MTEDEKSVIENLVDTISNLEKRMQNTEIALVAMGSLMKGKVSKELHDAIDRMLCDFFCCQRELGSTVGEGMLNGEKLFIKE